MSNNNDLKVAEMAKNFALELGREVIRNNRARARVQRYLREKHLEKVMIGGKYERSQKRIEDNDCDCNSGLSKCLRRTRL